MAKHNVNFVVPERPLGKSDIEFVIFKENIKFGTLKISRGAIVWVPRNKQKGFKLSWDDISILSKQHGRKVSV